MASSRLRQFVRFGTDAAGIERMLRMVQAILMVVLAQPFLASGFTKLVILGNQHLWVEPRISNIAVLSQLRGNVALARRFFRIFRFLESFQAAHLIYTSFYAPPSVGTPTDTDGNGAATTSDGGKYEARVIREKGPINTCANPNRRNHPWPTSNSTRAPVEAWLDIFSKAFNGMYLLLEAATLVDALTLPGFSLFGSTWFPLLHVEAQRFWLFALVCGVGSGLVKLFKLVAYGPPPASMEDYVWPSARTKVDGEEMAEWELQRERMRKMVWARRESMKMWKSEMRTRGYRTARRCVADILDLVVPGTVVGWVAVAPGTVGLCMLVSTWLTGVEVWEKCAE